jgi:hypothetical protein
MKNSVVVIANKTTGLVFNSTGISAKDGKEYGWYTVQSTFVDRSGALDKVTVLSALRSTSAEAFNAMPLVAGEILDGKIVIKESTTKNPFRANQEPKRKGKDGGILLFNGQPIYRETEFTSDLNAQNVLVAYTSEAPVAASTASAKLNA